jgi:hypothetical protein
MTTLMQREITSRTFLVVVFHLVLLLLASTNFTLITAPLGRSSLQWAFGGWAYANGWGYVYRSDYSLPQVCAYLLAYASGIGLYLRFMRPSILSRIAIFICAAGVASFAVELSHWVFDHNLSLILSLPIVLIAIDIWMIVRFRRDEPRLA